MSNTRRIDYLKFWEAIVSSWEIRPDLVGAALIDNSGMFLKQADFCRRDQRKILAACCASLVSIAINLTMNIRLENAHSIFLELDHYHFHLIIRAVGDEFCVALLVRESTKLWFISQILDQLTEAHSK